MVENISGKWKTYVLALKDGSLYTGITNDLDKRLETHRKGKGSKYVKTRLPLKLVWTAEFNNRSEASKEEYRIKRLTKKQKIALINGGSKMSKEKCCKDCNCDGTVVEEKPFPIDPILDRIIILKDSAEKEGKFHLPDSVKGRSRTGTVVAVGPGRINLETGEHLPLAVKAGDKVWLKEFDGYRFDLNGVTYHVFTENEIIGKVIGDV